MTISNSKIWSWEDAKLKIEQLKSQGKRIVFTNGCFDILHAGHVHYLQEASQLGDCLVVGLNTDNSVQRLHKSPARPLQSEISRSIVLSGLGCVTAVILFDQDTPKELIECITPNVLVKGADYSIDKIVGADWVIKHGGEVKTLEFLPGFSTTQIEKKILTAHGLH